jgi:hypothetical protein
MKAIFDSSPSLSFISLTRKWQHMKTAEGTRDAAGCVLENASNP